MTGPTITVNVSVLECLSLFSDLRDVCLGIDLFGQKAMFSGAPSHFQRCRSMSPSASFSGDRISQGCQHSLGTHTSSDFVILRCE